MPGMLFFAFFATLLILRLTNPPGNSLTRGIVLIAFGVPVGVALPAVLAYRSIAVWLPAPIAAAAVPRLRATIARWSREDASAAAAD